MSYRDQWNGRPVTFGEFNIKQGRAVRAALREDGEHGSYACLALSLRYADDNALVFQSADEVEEQPVRLQQRVMYLAAEALKINGFLTTDDEVPEGTEPNGHIVEQPGPSP
jgi:hypothetical protein